MRPLVARVIGLQISRSGDGMTAEPRPVKRGSAAGLYHWQNHLARICCTGNFSLIWSGLPTSRRCAAPMNNLPIWRSNSVTAGTVYKCPTRPARRPRDLLCDADLGGPASASRVVDAERLQAALRPRRAARKASTGQPALSHRQTARCRLQCTPPTLVRRTRLANLRFRLSPTSPESSSIWPISVVASAR